MDARSAESAWWWEREHAAYGLPFGPSTSDRQLRDAIPVMRALWAPGTKAAAGLPETTSYPRPVGPLPLLIGGRSPRVLQLAADSATDATFRQRSTRDTGCGSDERQAVTVLDVPVVGRDHDEVATLVERLRGRVSAAAYARTHHAGVLADHVARYRELGDSASTRCSSRCPICVAGADVEKFGGVLSALRN